MIKEPVLASNQYSVLMADGATGHVLTTNGNVCLNGEGEVFMIFEDLESAILFIKLKQSENDTWEFVIYNYNKECVESFEAIKWKRYQL